MVANHRRTAWVEVGAALAVLFALTPWTRTKRALARVAVLSSPLALLYVAIGWGSTASIFQPVQMVRSIVDSDADPSTAWRDWENYDLFYTLRQNPLFGTGYGHGYIEIVKLPDISQSYALYRFIPHNAILGLWAYGGLVGFTALWAMLVVGVFLAVRAHKHATKASDRAAALSALAAILVYLVHCFGDMGLGTWTSVFTVAPALAVAGQLAVATGAWPNAVRSARKVGVVLLSSEPSPPSRPALPAWGVSS
jgi:O-antigen ligase